MEKSAIKFEVERNVPIPNGKPRGRAKAYPFAEMKVGDSFLVPCRPDDAENKRMNILNAAAHLRKWEPIESGNFRIKTMMVIDGVRVWRIA